ncbi:50S ribosomal protein L23 [bacterium Unc6]|nr:50S ribosomal protein L23 [bacterium Unc6]
MKDQYAVVKSLLRTEKGTEQKKINKYLFLVDMKANKVQVKNAVEKIYSVKVEGVNTSIMSAKPKRVRNRQGWTSKWKKAVITLKEGNKIEAE